MRRISYLFTLLLLIVGAVSAYAQTPTATPIAVEEVPDGYYFIASTNESAYNLTNPYIVPNGDAAMKLVSQSAVTTDISTSNVGIWYIKKVEGSGASSKYTIRNIDGLYWVSGPDCPLANRSTNVGYYQFALTGTGANSYYLKGAGGDGNDKITNANPVWASNATTFARTPSTGSTNYDKWKLIPAGVKDITINYTAGSRTISVVKSAVKVGQEISTTFTADFYDSFTPENITVTSSEDSYAVTCTTSFPFEFGKFYRLKLREKDTAYLTNDTKEDGSSTNYKFRALSWNGNVAADNVSTRNALSDANGELWQFKPVEGTSNQVYLCSAVGGYQVYMSGTGNATKAALKPVGTPFVCQKANTSYEHGFRLAAVSDDNANLNDIDGKLGYWTPTGGGNEGKSKTDAGSTFTVFEPSELPIAVTTIKATNTATNEVITFDTDNSLYAVKTQTAGNVVVKGANSFFTVDDSNSSLEGTTLSVNYTSTAPYVLSGTTDETRHWQAIRSRNDNGHYLKLSGNNVASGPTKSAGSVNRSSLSAIKAFNETDEVQWGIVPADGGFNRFYLVNKANVTKKACLANETQSTLVTFTDKGTPFYLAAQPTLAGYTGGFTIQPNNSNTHAVGDHCSDNLGYWSTRGTSELADGGSIFHADLLADCKAIVDAQTGDESYVGSLAPSVPTALNALNGSGDQASITAYLAKYDELLTEQSSFMAPNASKIYYIHPNRISGNSFAAFTNAIADAEGTVNQGSGNYPNERLLTFTQTETPSVYVRFVPKNNGEYYLIQDVNSSLYYSYYADRSDAKDNNKLYLVANADYAGHYTIHNAFDGVLGHVGLKEILATDVKKQYLWCRGGSASQAEEYPMEFHSAYWNNATVLDENGVEPGCAYQVKAVESYTAAISAAGYASLCLPFSVTLPENGLTAYKVTDINRDNNNEMNLESVGSTIPAGEPVILQGAAGNHTLTINTDNGTKATNNILTGATVKRTGISEDYYALAKKTIDETETVAFFRVSTTNMPANKAYLLKKNIPAQADNAAMFMFNFDGNGGEVTDINTATKAETESNVYYDLNGRRVLYPSHGIYVKGNGQKVFIK